MYFCYLSVLYWMTVMLMSLMEMFPLNPFHPEMPSSRTTTEGNIAIKDRLWQPK